MNRWYIIISTSYIYGQLYRVLQNTCLFVYSVIGWEVGCLCHVSTPGLVAVASASSTQEEWDCGDTAQHTPDNNTKLKKMKLKQTQMALRDDYLSGFLEFKLQRPICILLCVSMIIIWRQMPHEVHFTFCLQSLLLAKHGNVKCW